MKIIKCTNTKTNISIPITSKIPSHSKICKIFLVSNKESETVCSFRNKNNYIFLYLCTAFKAL